MSRAFCIPAIFFLFSAFVLLFIVSISLPYLTAMDITRVHTNGTVEVTGDQSMSQLRLGIWVLPLSVHRSYCYTALNGNVVCSDTSHGYSLSIQNSANNTVYIGSSWTLGLAVHPVACGVSFIALLFSFSQHITFTLVASLVSFLAAILTLIAFAIDIALYAYFKNQMGNLGFGGNTITGPGFWVTFASMILLTLAGFTVCCGRRRGRMSNATSSTRSPRTGFFAKFRRN
ncbi:pali-domain-containing protein [Lanmaoa asiatica]|nr:pali-domain-containing protein [Lanmaoa asiatica]